METEKNNFKVNNLEKESSQLKLLDKNGPCMNEKRPGLFFSLAFPGQ